jgi:uncharacterized RDD family membrane protein YckC
MNGEKIYASFWKRVVATLIDGILLSILFRFIRVKTFCSPLILDMLIFWIYDATMESSKLQATLGKMALGIVVTDLNKERISFKRATGRHFAKYISELTLFIGFIMAAFTKERQGLHDMIAGTIVINEVVLENKNQEADV